MACLKNFMQNGTSAGSVRIAVSNHNTTNSTLINYTTTAATYQVGFTSGILDTSFTIYIGGSSPGSASAQGTCTLFMSNFNMYVYV